MYIFRAYQSPWPGTHCALQWFQMPNFASRNHSGVVHFTSDSHVGSNGPGATCTAGACAINFGDVREIRAAPGAAARAD